ncbi:hypothetical protein BDV19DRAFT_369079 [Aspergillus venezuelensis]
MPVCLFLHSSRTYFLIAPLALSCAPCPGSIKLSSSSLREFSHHVSSMPKTVAESHLASEESTSRCSLKTS